MRKQDFKKGKNVRHLITGERYKVARVGRHEIKLVPNHEIICILVPNRQEIMNRFKPCT